MGTCEETGLEMPVVSGNQAFPAEVRDVAFPYGVACSAITVCNRIADLLEGHLERRAEMLTEHLTDWEGGYQEEFTRLWGEQELRLGGLKEALRTLAGSVEGVWSDALVETNGRQETRESDTFDPGAYNPYAGI